MLIYIILIIIYIITIAIIEITSNIIFTPNIINLVQVEDFLNLEENIKNYITIETFKDFIKENFIGEIYIDTPNINAFYIKNNEYNLIEYNKLYKFTIPVHIEILNLKKEKIKILLNNIYDRT